MTSTLAPACRTTGTPRHSIVAAIPVAIKDTLAYFDTVRIWIPRYLERWEQDTIESLCGSVTYRPIRGSASPWMRRRGYRAQLVLHQPTLDGLQFLSQRLLGRPAPLINRVDCALDFSTATQAEAEKLQQYIDAHWYKPHHRRAHVVEIFAGYTTYIGFKNRKSRYVTYADRPSRHTGEPCCHLECRFQSTRTVAAIGVRSIGDLLTFDHPAFWRKRLRLYEYDLEALGKRWNGRHLSSLPRILKFGRFTYNIDQRTGEMLARTLINRDGADEPILMDLLADSARFARSLRGVLVAIPSADLLAALRPVD